MGFSLQCSLTKCDCAFDLRVLHPAIQFSCAGIFKQSIGARNPVGNRVAVPARQATQPGGIGSSESILTTTCEQKAAVLLYGVLVLSGLQLHEEALAKKGKRESSPAVF
jgi:hypothetical protein